MQTLHGRGAITISDDRHTYVACNGAIEVPDHLVPRVLAHGFTRHPLPVIEEEAPAPAVVVPAVQVSLLPDAHPQVAQAAQTEATDVSRIEAAVKDAAAAPATPASAPDAKPVPQNKQQGRR